MGQHVLTKTLSVFGGKNSRDDDVKRAPIFCRDAINFELSLKGSCQSRHGSKGTAKGAGGGGVATYRRTDATNRKIIEEVITIDDDLYRLKEGSITVNYSGSEDTHTLSITPTLNVDGTYTFHCVVLNGAVTDLDQDLGTGVDEAAPYAINSLITAINGLTDFACALATGVGTGPAAFLPNLDNLYVEVAPSNSTIYFDYWEVVPCPTANPFATFWAGVNTEAFENASLQNCDDQLFIATGKNELYVYDSLATYRAGMPAATALAYASESVGGGSRLTLLQTYEYFITYEFQNKVSKVIEGSESNRVTHTLTGANNTITLTIPNIQAATGFYTHSAQIAGVGTGTTIPVSAGHNIVVGDVVNVPNPTTGMAQDVTVTQILTGPDRVVVDTSVGYSNANPNVITMSTVRINVWRNAAGDTELKYLVIQMGNNQAAATSSLVDAMPDSTLIGMATYDPPAKLHDLPPANLKYLTVYNTLLCGCTGVDEEVWFSDWDGPHYFPADSSAFNIRSKTASLVTGISGTRELLCITKDRETHLTVGDLPNANFRQEMIADAIGCDAHATMVLVDNVLCFWSNTFGFRRVFSSGILADWSFRILPDWNTITTNSSEAFIPKRAIALADPERQRIFLYLPAEDSFHHNSYSRVYLCDYRDSGKAGADGEPMVRWWPCKNLNMQGGATIYKGVPYFMERRYGLVTGVMEYNLCKLLYDNTEDDFCDHAQPMETLHDGPWYHMDEPSVLKKWTNVKLYKLEEGVTSDADMTLQLEKDFINGVSSSEKIFTADSASSFGWGYGAWGTSMWGGFEQKEWLFEPKITVSEAVKLVVKNDELWCQQIGFNGTEFELVPDYEVEISDT